MEKITKHLRWLLASLMLVVGMSSAWAQSTSTLTFTDKCNGSGTADDNVAWTVTSDGAESNFDGTKGIHYGTSSAKVQYIKLTTSGISGTITKVVVNASTASGVSATASVTVGGSAFGGDAQSLSTSATDYTFEGSATGEIIVTVTKPSSAAKALYVKSVAVTYTSGGGTIEKAATPTFSPAAGTYTSAQSVELNTTTAGATIYYTTDGTDPTTSSSVYASAINVSTTTTIKAIAVKEGMDNSTVASATYTIVNIEHAGTEADPYTVADAIAYIGTLGSSTSGTVYVTGKISQIDSYNSTYGSITYWISDDGTTNNQMEVYSGLNLESAKFSSKDDIETGKTVTVCGTVKMYNSTPEFNYNNYLVYYEGATVDTGTETHIVFLKGQGSAEEEQIPSGSNIEMTVGDNVVFTPARMAIYNSLDQEIIKVTTEGEITYTVDKPELGTVNEISGEVTLVAGATGTLKVTAEYAGSSEYKPSTGYYTLKVNPAEVTPTGDGDEITHDFVGVTGTTYNSWSGKEGTSGAVYAGNTAGGNNAVQMRSTNSSGIITTTSGGKVTMVTVEWNDNTSNSRTLDIYGSNTAYTSAANLYDSSKQGTKLGSIVYGTSTQLAIEGDYAYIGIRSNNGALYCNKITIYWENSSSSAVATTTTIDATGLTNTDVNASTDAGTLTATVMAGSTAVSGATVTWESSNTAVATVDADGVVTLVAAGSTTITATYAGVTDQYQSSSDTYELTVTNSSVTPGDELFNETFAGFEGSGGRDDVYSGSVGENSTASTDEEGWTFDKCGGASSSLKFGTGSVNGVFTTRSIALTGDGTLTFSAAGWGSGTNTLAVTATGGTLSGDTNITLTNSEWSDYTINLTDATGELVLTFTGKRGFIDDIKVVSVSATPDERTATTTSFNASTESYEVTLGEAFTAPTATLDPAAAGSLIYESSDPAVATVNASTGAVEILAAGTTTITAKFEGTTKYKPSQASYTITVTAPATVYTTIQQLQEAATSTSTDITFQMTDIYVTAVRNNQAWISDGTYGALIYTAGHGLTAGKKLNGTITGKLVLYNGATEITNFDGSALTTTDEALAVQTKTIGQIELANQSLPVKFEGVTYDATAKTFSDGTNTIAFYDQFAVSPTLEDNHTYEITGIIVYFNKLQIAPLAATDVVDVTPAATVEAPVFDPAGGTYTEAKTVTITCETAGASIYYTLDGTDPTTASTKYTAALTISETTTLKAIASDGTNVSTITTATYTIETSTAPYAKNIKSDYWKKVTDLSQLENGDAVLIVNEEYNKALGEQRENNNRGEAEITWIPYSEGNIIDGTSSSVYKLTLVKNGEYYYFYDAVNKGYLYAAGGTSKNYLKVEETADDKAKAAINLTAGTIIFQTNGRNTLMYNSNAGLFSCYTSGQESIQLYVEVEKPTAITVDLVEDQDNYKTMVAPFDMVAPNVSDGVEAYIVTLNTDQTDATFERVTNIPAGTPMVLHANSAGSYALQAADASFTADNVSANELKVSDGSIEGDGTIFVLNKSASTGIGFYRLNNGMPLATGKCYLKIEKNSSVKFIGFNFDDVATGIETVESTMDKVQGTIYDLQGRRVTTPAHGLYIVNGKKVFIK